MTLKEKVELANKNIEELVSYLINFSKNDHGCCCYTMMNPNEDCSNIKCSDCKEKYYKQEYQKMLDRYMVK